MSIRDIPSIPAGSFVPGPGYPSAKVAEAIPPVTTQQIVIGLIPCQNRYYLDLVWPIIKPGVVELANASEGEWTDFRVWSEIYGGSFQLYMIYLNTDPAKPGVNQEAFVEKLKTPDKDYAGFYIIQLLQTSVHVFAAWVQPEYRKSNVISRAGDFLEEQVKGMGAPYLSLATHPMFAEALFARGYKRTTVNFRKKL